jgi:hypothetical protein
MQDESVGACPSMIHSCGFYLCLMGDESSFCEMPYSKTVELSFNVLNEKILETLYFTQ